MEKKTIKELRAKKGLSGVKLAEMIGVSHATVVNWEKGKKIPSVLNALDLAKALDTTVEQIKWEE